jgi:hypothetical protein
MTLLEIDTIARATVPKHRRSGKLKKGMSAYAPGYDPDLERAPGPIALARIRPERHVAAFREAMDIVERESKT